MNIPQDLTAERAVLGSVLIDNSVLEDCELVPEAFFIDLHRRLFSLMVRLYADGKPVDLVHLTSVLRDKGVLDQVGGPAALAALADEVPTSVNFDHYCKLVENKWILRRVLEVTGEITRLVQIEEEPRNVLDEAEDLVLGIADNERKSDFQGLSVNMVEHLRHVENIVKKQEPVGILTGFQCLDRRTNGLHPGELIILAARPAMGKTTLALNIATNVAEGGDPVGVLSLEMSEESLRIRVICSRCEIDSSAVRAGKLSEDELHTYVNQAQKMNKLPLYINDDPRTSLLRLKSSARRLKRKQNIKLLVIDYMQLMSSGMKQDNRVNEVSYISRELKLLAKALHIPILVLSQLNRSSEKEKSRWPRLSDLRDSGSIEQDADMVMFLYMKDITEEETKLIMPKNRAGATGDDDLYFKKTYNRFVEYTG